MRIARWSQATNRFVFANGSEWSFRYEMRLTNQTCLEDKFRVRRELSQGLLESIRTRVLEARREFGAPSIILFG